MTWQRRRRPRGEYRRAHLTSKFKNKHLTKKSLDIKELKVSGYEVRQGKGGTCRVVDIWEPRPADYKWAAPGTKYGELEVRWEEGGLVWEAVGGVALESVDFRDRWYNFEEAWEVLMRWFRGGLGSVQR